MINLFLNLSCIYLKYTVTLILALSLADQKTSLGCFLNKILGKCKRNNRNHKLFLLFLMMLKRKWLILL